MSNNIKRYGNLIDKPLPHNLEAEQAVIAGILRYESLRPEILSLLQPRDFFNLPCRQIYTAIQRLDNDGKIIDVCNVLRDPDIVRAEESQFWDTSLVADLYSMAVLGASASERSHLVSELAKKRRIIEASLQAIEDGFEVNFTSESIVQKLDAALQEGIKDDNTLTASSNKDIASQVINEALCPNEEESGLLKTGLDALDNIIDGFMPGNLIIVGGRPGMGKSIFALTLADNLQRDGKNVLLFSLEMSRKEVIQRQVSFLSHVPLRKIRFQPSTLEAMEKNALVEAGYKLQDRTGILVVDEDMDANPIRIRQRARSFQKEHGSLDCIIVDYLQIMSPDEKINGNRELEVARMCKSMKALAKQLGTVVVVLSQLNRKSEDRASKRPSLSDLRESGALEQDADMAILVFRNLDKYAGDEIPAIMEAELDVAKNRSGSTGTAVVACETRLAHFANMTKRAEF